jgi:hypothetical protein
MRPEYVIVENQQSIWLHFPCCLTYVAGDTFVRMIGVNVNPIEIKIREFAQSFRRIRLLQKHTLITDRRNKGCAVKIAETQINQMQFFRP